jgi:molybdopterin-binding protein
MKLSARNNLTGKIIGIDRGQIMAKVKIDIGGQFITSLISVDAADDLVLKPGDTVQAIIKSTEVILGK